MIKPRILLACSVLLCGAPAPAQKVLEIVEMEESEFGAIVTRLKIQTLLNEVSAAWMRRSVEATTELAQRLIEANPLDHRGYALEYIAHTELALDRRAANQVASRAIAKLGPKPLQLVEFITTALYANPQANDYQLALMTLVPIVADHRKVAAVRVAHLRALMGCQKIKEAVITNKSIVEDIGDDHAGLLLLASAICDMKDGRSLAGVADKAVSKVLAKNSRSEQHLLVKYRILELLGRHQEALTLGQRIVADMARTTGSLNNWVWYLMTKRSTAGKYPGLAELGARMMMQSKTLVDYELDTIALALFRAGKLCEAVDYQRRAVEAGGDANYRERLKMYRAALAKQQTDNKPNR